MWKCSRLFGKGSDSFRCNVVDVAEEGVGSGKKKLYVGEASCYWLLVSIF